MTWWRVWGGHTLVLIMIGLVFLAMFLLWLSTRSSQPDETFWLGMGFVVVAVVAFCVGAFAAYHWNTPAQRRMVRARQEPVGGDE
jgi:hypothetical protein